MHDRGGCCCDIDASNKNKNQRDHQCGRNGAKVEYVNVGQERSLRPNHLPDQRHRLPSSVARGRAVSCEIMGHLLQCGMEHWRARRGVLNQARLMELFALHQRHIGKRDADAAAKGTGDVDQRRGLVGFIRGQPVISHGIDRNE